jgi:hypothetical protein
MDFRDIGMDGANCIWLAQDRFQWQAFASTVMNLQGPYRKEATVSCFSPNQQAIQTLPHLIATYLDCSKKHHMDAD